MEEEKSFNIDDLKKDMENDKKSNDLLTMNYIQKEIRTNYKKNLPDLNLQNQKDVSILEIINLLLNQNRSLKEENKFLTSTINKKKKTIKNLENKNSEIKIEFSNLEIKLRDVKLSIKKNCSSYENTIRNLGKEIKKLQFDLSQNENKLIKCKENFLKKNISKKDKKIILIGKLRKEKHEEKIPKQNLINSSSQNYIIKQKKIINQLIFSNRTIFERLRNFCLKQKQFIIKKSEELKMNEISKFNEINLLEENYNNINIDQIEVEDILKKNLVLNSYLDFIKEFEFFLNSDFKLFLDKKKTRCSLYKKHSHNKINSFSGIRDVFDLQILLDSYSNLAHKQKEVTFHLRDMIVHNAEILENSRLSDNKRKDRVNVIKGKIQDLENFIVSKRNDCEKSKKEMKFFN